jgi:hypothetical protein
LGNDLVVTREQIVDLIKTEKMRPSDLFSREALDSDPVVHGLAEARVEEKIGAEYRRRKVAEEKLATLQSGQNDKEAALQKKIESLEATTAKSQIGPLLEKQKVERKLDDRQMKFIQKRLSTWTPLKPGELEKEFNSFLDGQIDEYKAVAKEVFGIEETPTGDNQTPGGGAGPDDRSKDSTISKYLDPAQNPMIRTAGGGA